VAATTVGPPSALNAVECHPTPSRWFTVTELDADFDFPDPGAIVAMSPALWRHCPGSERYGISLESQDYFEQLEIIFFPL
jgi:hypothetical protein